MAAPLKKPTPWRASKSSKEHHHAGTDGALERQVLFHDVLKGNLENNMAAQAECAEEDDANRRLARQAPRHGAGRK